MRICIGIVLAGLGSACLPFAVPPARVETGLGARWFEREAPSSQDSVAEVGVVRAGFHPTQLLEAPAERSWDFGLGYRAEWRIDAKPATEGRSAALQGPYAEVGVYPLRASLGSGTRLRWGGYASADAVFGEDRKFGPGATLGTLLEVTGDGAGSFTSTDSEGGVTGLAYGQWALGLFAHASLRRADDRFSQSLITGLSFRLPFVAGVACCFLPEFSPNKDSDVASLGPEFGASDTSSSRSDRARPSKSKQRRYRAARPRRKP